MKKERFEELVEIMAKAIRKNGTVDDSENDARAALTAVYPLIQDNVIEEVAKRFETSGPFQPREPLEKIPTIIRALKSKDTKL